MNQEKLVKYSVCSLLSIVACMVSASTVDLGWSSKGFQEFRKHCYQFIAASRSLLVLLYGTTYRCIVLPHVGFIRYFMLRGPDAFLGLELFVVVKAMSWFGWLCFYFALLYRWSAFCAFLSRGGY